ncbi:MAG: phosphatase PAP2 family protein [Treponema sp.]|nr:phosphatase PAP2 family protein [Treponema sp.]
MELLRMIESIRSPFLDILIGLITRLGEEELILVVVCAIFWSISKQFAYKAGMVFFLSSITVQGGKIAFRIERPWVIDPGFNPVPSAMARATGYSFPSGHTQAAAALFGSLGAEFKKVLLKVICFSIVFLVAFSRMYLGLHTLLDVATSVAFTLLMVFIVFRLFRDDIPGERLVLGSAIFIILYAAASIIYAGILFSNGIIEEVYLIDCGKSAGAAIGFAVGMLIETRFINFSISSRSIPFHILKFVLGFAGVMAIKEGMKLIVGVSLATDIIRYFLMILWIFALYPLIIKRFFED